MDFICGGFVTFNILFYTILTIKIKDLWSNLLNSIQL